MHEQVEVNSERWFDLTPLLNEEWKDIKNYEGYYQISNYGRVKSLKRHTVQFNGYQNCNKLVKEKIRKFSQDKDGYWICTLYNKDYHKWCRAHIMLAKAFIPNPENKPQVNHKDGNKQNLRISNLEWCTNQENRTHAKKHGLVRKGQKIGKYNEKGELLKIYNNARDCAEEENYTYTQLRSYIYRKICKNGYKWGYLSDNNLT